MLPFLFTVTVPKAAPVEAIRDAIASVLVRFRLPIKAAAFEMQMPRQNLERSLRDYGPSVARLAMLPQDVKRSIWQALKPFFGYDAAEADNPELEQRLADLEAAREREAREREALQERFNELEALVRRLSRPASTDTPHEEQRIA